MKIIESLSCKTLGMLSAMALMLLLPGVSAAQTNTVASPDATVIPWLGVWEAIDAPVSQNIKDRQAQAILEIRPTSSGKGFDISRKAAEQSAKETVIPDGTQRSEDSKNCNRSQTYNWEPQTGLLLGSLEIKCKDSASYNISNLKMMVSADEMVDIVAIKSSGQTHVAVRHFEFAGDLPSTKESLPGQDAIAMRTALAAPLGI
jgi:hypothetical protein